MKRVLIIQNCEIESPGTIRSYLDENGYEYRTIHSYRDEPLPPLESVDAVINLGCPVSMTAYRDHGYLKTLYAFVAQVARQNKPYLGICFGAQMLAHVLGARVEPNKVKEIGTYDVRLTEAGVNNAVCRGLKRTMSVFHWHGDTFRVPFGAELLAEGDECINQAFRQRNQIGLQFHLEADTDEVALWCDVYETELAEVGKTKEAVVEQYRQVADGVRAMNYRLLDNFFRLGN